MVYTLNFVANPDNKVVTRQNVTWIDRAEKIDAYKVRIICKEPFPAAIEYLAGPVVIHPHEYYAKVGPKGMNEKPVGSGPYRVTEHSVGKFVRMERNPDYFKDSPKPQPKIEKVEIRFIPDRQTQVAEMMAGGADLIMNVALDQATQMKAVPTLQVVSGETMRIVFLHLDTRETLDRAATARSQGAPGHHPCDRSRKHGQADRRRRRARAEHPVFPVAVRLHRRGRAALFLRPGEGQEAAR